MKKRELIWVLILSLLLGVSATLALAGQGGFGRSSLARSANPDPTQTLMVTSVSTASNVDPAALQATPLIGNRPAAVTPAPATPSVEAVPGAAADIEDVLLLYDSARPGVFAVNFCKIAEYYGLLCQSLDLNHADLTDQALRDSQGAYFRLIGIDAPVVLLRPASLSETEISLLRAAVETSGANLFISKVVEGDSTSILADLTAGAVTGVLDISQAHHNWVVSSLAPEITRQFTGQLIDSPSDASHSMSALILRGLDSVTSLIYAINDTGVLLPVFARSQTGAGAVFIDAGQWAWAPEEGPLRDIYYNSAGFSRIIPLMMAMRAALGDEAWHNDHDYANLTIDDPALVEPFYELSYIELLAEMLAHNFHTTIALIPARWEQSQPQVVSLFQHYPELFSIVQQGNNHDGYEFYKYQVTADDENQEEGYTSRPLVDQVRDMREGLARMEMHRDKTGLPFDPVMVFPYGISPAQTLGVLKQYNYLATVNAQDVPLDSEEPADWDFGMYPAEMEFENFPLLTRRQPGAYQPFQPDVQPFIFDLFLDKPALFYTHANEGELFADGISAFNPVADRLNALSGGVEWQSLGTILKRLYLEKTNDDGSLDIRMYAASLILANESSSEQVYYIAKEETLNIPIASVTINGQDASYWIDDDFLRLDVSLEAGSAVEISIAYGD